MLDFKEIDQDGTDFELLIRELLIVLGYRVYWSGRGADGGKDLLCIESRDSFFALMKGGGWFNVNILLIPSGLLGLMI